ncbi:GAF domain/GGDEF domain protein [Minicystis rosea]|nr:GAF domain/GGDEF domain protein [Minicystis rosea]
MSDDEAEITRVANLGELQQELNVKSKRDRPYLHVLAGSNIHEMYRLEESETFLGRGQNATIRLNDDGISRRHARIFQSGGELVIEDLKSSNGTTVNGTPVTLQTLKDGDKIRLGSTTILKFTYNDHLDEHFQQQMYEAATLDGLTKAYNKTYFLKRLDEEIAYARRHQTHLSLLMFDVDHFKRVNDTYGHLAGDYVLQRLAKVAMSTVRAEDVFARYGGEEFGVICRGVPLPSAGVLGERLRSTVEATPFEHGGLRLPVTISIGVAGYPEAQVETRDQFIAAADSALYEAKRGGRNRVLLKL